MSVSAVTIRESTATGLITDIVDAAGHWRYLEDLPPSVLLSESDVRAAGPASAALVTRVSPTMAVGLHGDRGEPRYADGRGQRIAACQPRPQPQCSAVSRNVAMIV
jgi:hypothetical protein